MSPKKEICDASKLHLFEECMPPTLQGEIRLMQKKSGDKLTFFEVLAKFEGRYATGGSAKLRKKWIEVSMVTSGKITTRQLREFQVNFLGCAEEVKDTNASKPADFCCKNSPIHENLGDRGGRKKGPKSPNGQFSCNGRFVRGSFEA